jgi:mono/diheme cytochrome c family protein
MLTMLVSCHSSDLGSQKPEKVNVNLALTGWESGAGEVIVKKCANCHTAARSKFVPDNTPHELDGIESIAFFQDPANLGFAKMMLKRIESTDETLQMPPKFATPLYDDEKTAVIAFLKGIVDGSIDPCLATTKTFVALRHGDRGDDRDDDDRDDDDRDDDDRDDDARRNHTTPTPTKTPNKPIVSADPCSNSGNAGNGGGGGGGNGNPTTITFADVAQVVQDNCAMCHNGSRRFALITREDFFNSKPGPLNEILAGRMPPRDPNFQDTPEGQLLVKWLQGSQEQ